MVKDRTVFIPEKDLSISNEMEGLHLVKTRGHFCPKLVQNICFGQKFPPVLTKWIPSISFEMEMERIQFHSSHLSRTPVRLTLASDPLQMFSSFIFLFVKWRKC
jgi:hypothetical protein